MFKWLDEVNGAAPGGGAAGGPYGGGAAGGPYGGGANPYDSSGAAGGAGAGAGGIKEGTCFTCGQPGGRGLGHSHVLWQEMSALCEQQEALLACILCVAVGSSRLPVHWAAPAACQHTSSCGPRPCAWLAHALAAGHWSSSCPNRAAGGGGGGRGFGGDGAAAGGGGARSGSCFICNQDGEA